MPELPSVEIFKKYFNGTCLHKTIKDVEVFSPEILVDISSEDMLRSLKGHKFTGSHRYGKYLFAKLDQNLFLIIHFGMTGYLYYGDTEESSAHPRMNIYFKNGTLLTFDDARKFGKLGLTTDPGEFIKMKKLGPDALNVSLDRFQEIFNGRKGMIKPLLMNQQVIAGIGNLYADEILYQSAIHPLTHANRLDESEWEILYLKTKQVLKKAIEYQDKTQSLPESYLLPHRHPGGQCPEGGDLEIIKVGGRTTFLCPHRQKIK
ncbi:MAG: Fpg/Nei family DNA glycosylase [Methanobacteriaceae archaeon]|nr:Fpg/Nei family DNA glycosylase [Methanobacteriaceae archaeon]